MHLRMGEVGGMILGLGVVIYYSIKWYGRKHKVQ
jgi:hypothetical protein